MTLTVTTVMTMTVVESGKISQKPALTVVMSIDVSIDTKIISDLESYAYSADHPDHSKFYIREPIRNRDLEPIRYRHRDVENIRMKTGVYRGRGGHPLETLTALGYHTFNTYGYYYGHCHGQSTALCLLTALDETALETSVLKIPSSEAIQNHSTGAENGTRLSSSKDHRGRSGGRGILSESDIFSAKKSFAKGARSATGVRISEL